MLLTHALCPSWGSCGLCSCCPYSEMQVKRGPPFGLSVFAVPGKVDMENCELTVKGFDFICQGRCPHLTLRGCWGAILLYAGKKKNHNHSTLFEFLSKMPLFLQMSVFLIPLEIKNKIVWWFVIIFEVIDNYTCNYNFFSFFRNFRDK